MMKSKFRRYLLLLLTLPAVLWVGFVIADYCFPLPIYAQQPTQTVLAKHGVPLWRFADNKGVWRYPVSLDDVPDYYLEALLTYEDRHFYHHFGIDVLAMLRAAYQNLSHGKIISGGSTLTMQVARILEPHDRTLSGKLQQLFRALQLEWHYSKKEILTLYINRAPYGGALEGIGAASWSYLGKPPNQLNHSEAALLAVLPQAPSYLRPDRYPLRAQQARDKVLQRLATYQVWSPEQIARTQQEEVTLYPRQSPQFAPLLARRLSRAYPQQAIIHSTIDLPVQYTLEELALNLKNQLPPKTSLAMLVVDHTDMTVNGYVGSIDFNDTSRFGQIDMIRAKRSPGSTLKPLLYGLAISDGMIHSKSLLQDVPRINSDYRPQNFDQDFHGPVSVSEALQRSLNVPAVQVMELYGPTRFVSQLNAVGLDLLAADKQPNVSYILGGTSVRLEQLLSVYSAFTRQGKVAPLRFTQTEPLIEKPLMSAGSAWVIRRILAKQPVPMVNQPVDNIAPLAWKTGTSYGYRDAWAVGMNARYLIGVWVGRPDGTPVIGQYGYVTAVPILQQVSAILLNKERNRHRPLPTDPIPDSVSNTTICWPMGLASDDSGQNCHRQKRAWIVDDMIPPTLDQWHVTKNSYYRSGSMTIWVNSAGLRVAADCQDAQKQQIALWPVAVENWLLTKEQRQALLPPVDETCPLLGEGQFPQLFITGIVANQVFRIPPDRDELTLTVNSQGGLGNRWWFLDGQLMHATPAATAVKLTLTAAQRGSHHLLLLDESGQIDRIPLQIQ